MCPHPCQIITSKSTSETLPDKWQIGVPSKDFNIHQAVLYTHGYFQKVQLRDGVRAGLRIRRRQKINAQTISDQMMINLNYSDVEDFKETVGITNKYSGELLRLVDIEFPDEMEAETNPPVHDDVDTALEFGLEVDSDNYDSEDDFGDYDSDSDREEEEFEFE